MEEGRTAGPPAGPIRTRQPSPFGAAPAPPPAEGIAICPYLAREGPDGALGPAVPTVDSAHRCTALADAVPQSARQQELVCLTAAHANCPRFLRGRQLVEAVPVVPVRQPISPAVIIAALVFVAAIAASFGFLAVRGGFDLALSPSSPSDVSAASNPAPSDGFVGSSVAPATPPSSGAAPTAGSSQPAPTPSPSPAVTPSPTPSPTPVRTPKPKPTSDRFAVLTECPATPNCWIYVIRSGDNLVSIANWFGVDYDRMRAMNPNLRVPIHAGDRLRIPTPTR